MAMTGGLASGGKVMLITLQMWEEDVNARGGLLGRPVELVYYDDQTNGSLVPGIYTKLLDVDKVDLLVGGYATNVVAPAMPVIMQRNKVFLSMFCIAAQHRVQVPALLLDASGRAQIRNRRSAEGFFDVATAQSPKPQTIAIVAADAESAERHRRRADNVKRPA